MAVNQQKEKEKEEQEEEQNYNQGDEHRIERIKLLANLSFQVAEQTTQVSMCDMRGGAI